jgi:hypothetical protein
MSKPVNNQTMLIDRAKAIRDERQCSIQEAVKIEKQEFEAANGGPLRGAALARWCYENPNLAARTIEGLREITATNGKRNILFGEGIK